MSVVAPAAALDKTCGKELREATELYEIGRLATAAATISQCLDGERQPAKRVRIESHELLAKIYLARDEQALADAEIRRLLLLEPNFKPDVDAPPRFQANVARMRRETSGERVSSVSKVTEDPRRAPATAEVITAEEISQRGYLDLEAVLHDLPGFDISRGNGSAYSNIYQRGYRSPTTDRILFLVDGIEHNDLTSNVAFLSRQYPLTNIERVEVVYGPASTIYGANAFVGVINVITKDPVDYLDFDEEGKRENSAVHVVAGGGSWNTRYIDATVAGGTADGDLQFSLTGRLYQSDEPDLSGFEDWDYDPAFFDTFDYQEKLGFTAEQAARARELDRAVYTGEYQGAEVGFSDLTDAWYVAGKLKTSSFEFGFQTWQRREGATPWYTDGVRPGARNGAVWAPEQTAFYIRYGRTLTDSLSAFIFSRYKVHGTTPDSSSFSLRTYANEGLDADDLAADRPAFWRETIMVRSSNQLRNEVGVVYEPSSSFNLVAGLELRNGSIQGDYARSEAGEGEEPDPPTNGGEHFDVRDVGAYVQATFRVLADESLKLVVGGRFDHNELRPTGGYGEAFNPRLAAVYSRGGLVLKAIYSEAFKDASNFNRFATSGSRRVNNPDLGVEEVENIELSASWHAEDFDLSLSAYRAAYSDAVGLRTVADPDDSTKTTGQFQNLGALEIHGLQASFTWRSSDRYDIYANYTYTDPQSVEPLDQEGNPRVDVDELRIGDIARHQLNLGVHARLWGRHLVDVRVNHVGDRQTGEGTTVATNPFREVEAHTVVHASFTYTELARGLDLQLLVQNLTDERYAHPGVRDAGVDFAALAPQPGRSVFLRAMLRF